MDTNILFTGLYSSTGASFQILKRLNNREIKPVISTTLLFEYEDVLKREQIILELSHSEVDVRVLEIINVPVLLALLSRFCVVIKVA